MIVKIINWVKSKPLVLTGFCFIVSLILVEIGARFLSARDTFLVFLGIVVYMIVVGIILWLVKHLKLIKKQEK